MDDVLWRRTLESGLAVSATPISRATWAESQRPLVRAANGRRLAPGRPRLRPGPSTAVSCRPLVDLSLIY